MYQPDIENVFKFPAADQARYGNSGFGNALITARNAVRGKNGMVFTYVTHGGWDNHANLFVVDGSLHVTNGGFNPVLTIMALAFRSAAHIVSAHL